jgi:signal peptidase II
MYFIVIAALTVLDQAVKYIIRENLYLGETIPVIENILHITYVSNSGGAFSLLRDQTALLTILPSALIAAIIIYIYLKRKTGPVLVMLGLSLICAGGLGNLIDRVRFSAVTDFIDFRVFPVFNVADICVCCGCGLIVLLMILESRREKRGAEKQIDG